MGRSARAERAQLARERLERLGPRWVPTAESVAAELAGARAVAPRLPEGLPAGEGPPVVQPPLESPPRHRRPAPDEPGAGWLGPVGRPALVAVGLLCAGALVGAGGLWLAAAPRGDAVPATGPAPGPVWASQPSPGQPAAGDPAAATPLASPGVVVVAVEGRVRQPGVVELAAGSRVHDAIAAAGGVTRRADTLGLNLARVLGDGELISVGPPPGQRGQPPPAAGSPGAVDPSAAEPVDLNTATGPQLEALPGIGPVLAARILEWRTTHGRFTSPEQLREVSGIGDATYADLAPLVRV